MGSQFNTVPNHYREIDEHEFGRIFCHYVFHDRELRQFNSKDIGPEISNAYLFQVLYNGWEELGVALAHDFWGKKMRYFKYGAEEVWKQKEAEFASQFAGDNS